MHVCPSQISWTTVHKRNNPKEFLTELLLSQTCMFVKFSCLDMKWTQNGCNLWSLWISTKKSWYPSRSSEAWIDVSMFGFPRFQDSFQSTLRQPEDSPVDNGVTLRRLGLISISWFVFTEHVAAVVKLIMTFGNKILPYVLIQTDVSDNIHKNYWWILPLCNLCNTWDLHSSGILCSIGW